MASNLPAHVPDPVADYGSWAQVIRYARCADSGLDPEAWFPVSANAAAARREAAAAIAVCSICLVRVQCLALSLRHWDIGQHGIWGGLVAADRARLRRERLGDHGGAAGLPFQNRSCGRPFPMWRPSVKAGTSSER